MSKPTRRRAAVHAGTLVDDVLGQRKLRGAIREHRLVTDWVAIVGARIAARAWPDGLQKGVLFVRVINSSWLHELSFLRDAIAEAANRELGAPPLVKEVRLHLGARTAATDDADVVAALASRAKPKVLPRPRPQADVPTLARIDVETAKIRDDDLREIVRNVRRRLGL